MEVRFSCQIRRCAKKLWLSRNFLRTVMYHILLRLCSDVSDVSGHAVTLSQYSDTLSFRTLHNLHSFKIHMLHPLHDPLHDPCHHSRFCGNTIVFCYTSQARLWWIWAVMYHILPRLCSDVSDVSGHAVTLSQYSDTRSFRTLHNLHSFKIHMLHPLHDPCHHSRFCGNTIIFCYISFLWLTIVLLLWSHLLTILTFITYSGISDVLYKSLVASGQNSSL